MFTGCLLSSRKGEWVRSSRPSTEIRECFYFLSACLKLIFWISPGIEQTPSRALRAGKYYLIKSSSRYVREYKCGTERHPACWLSQIQSKMCSGTLEIWRWVELACGKQDGGEDAWTIFVLCSGTEKKGLWLSALFILHLSVLEWKTSGGSRRCVPAATLMHLAVEMTCII